ncbi:MFS general substrate transporter isoform A [Chlorella sorokiniana]|uniref:MFS general substrate transporter isoform A n=1 Tax=Chlorella sorokiniana TaxID=3076 RepID=A0A2P6TFH6_CHLSO|nr:MFS general substrate transporter isoform A [Chlorella sorokiniana]|eukprot:PRW32866.1 MFS general substrate transporter isoform A [Chlorella sorokiniana]
MKALDLEPPMTGSDSAQAAQKHKLRTTCLINLASILEKCDEQILPAVYAWVGASFQATPAQLGYITLGRALMQALSSPLGGVAGHFMPRGHVVAAGCWLWATMTALFAMTTRLAVAMPICAVNGIGLALVIPNVQSLTADYYPSSARGKAFGALWLTISLGGMLGALYATNTAAHSPLGMEGWRFVFLSVAVVSAITGLLNYLFVHDPTFHRHQQQQQQQQQLQQASSAAGSLDGSGSGGGGGEKREGAVHTAKRLAREIGGVMRIPTFGIIIIQGIIGSVPYASLIFLTLYFQLMGMSNSAASVMVALYLLCGGLGGLLGGWIGDKVAARWPDHGRIAATQFSVIVGVPFALLIFKALPMNGDPATVWLYGFIMSAWALLTAWPAPCCNNPAFAEIVPPAQRNLVYAFDRCFEGAMAAFSVPLVGILAEDWFGFHGDAKITGNRSTDLANAKALGSALLAFTTVPWTFCFLMYSGLHISYPKDRRRALEWQRAQEQQEWQFEADSAASLAEEAVPLRERSISPPRMRPSPSPLHPDSGGGSSAVSNVRGRSARSGDLINHLRRESGDRQQLLHRPPSDLH